MHSSGVFFSPGVNACRYRSRVGVEWVGGRKAQVAKQCYAVGSQNQCPKKIRYVVEAD